MIEKRIVVEGDVQGVFFRANTLQHATQLGLVGTVQNLPNGNVEIYVQGKEVVIEQLLNILQTKLYPEHIRQVTQEVIHPPHQLRGFRVI